MKYNAPFKFIKILRAVKIVEANATMKTSFDSKLRN